MAALGSLVVSLEANTARFQSDMGKAAYQTEQAMKKMERDAQMVGAALGAMAVTGGVALGLMVRNAINAADNLRDMAQKTGIAVEQLNGLGFAAGQAGGNLDSMVSAAGKLNKSIAEAAGGNKDTSEAFKALGINVLDATGNLKKADVVMAEVADKFEQFQNGPEKSAIALALFGKAGADMIPLLNDGGAAMRENIAYAQQYSGVTTELANASDNFNDTMGKLTLQQQGFANAMTAAVLPILQAIADETLRASEESNKFEGAAGAVRTVLQTVAVVGSEVAFVFKGVGTEIGGIAAQLAALASGDFKAFTFIGDAMKADAEKARKEHDAFIARLMNDTLPAAVTPAGVATKPNAPRLPGRPDTTGKAAGKTPEQQAEEEGQRLIKRLSEAAATYGKTGAAVLEYQLAQSKMPQQYKDQAMALQLQIDGLRASDEAQKKALETAKQLTEEKERAAAQVTFLAEGVMFSLMNEAEQEQLAHEKRLEALQAYHDLRLENVVAANAAIEAENARHEQAKADMQASYELQSLAMFGNTADQLYDLMEKSGQEQSALAKAVFLASKAIAVAEIILNTEVAAAKAGAQLGIFGIPMAAIIRATGYASAGMVAGMAIAEASAEGGYDIPAGKNPVTQLHEKEMVLPKQQADVIRGLAANGGGGKITIVNQTTGRIDKVTEQSSGNDRAIIIQESVLAVAAQLNDPNSKVSRAMGRNYAAQRSR